MNFINLGIEEYEVASNKRAREIYQSRAEIEKQDLELSRI